MKIKEQTRKLAAGCSKHCFEVVDKTDEVSSKHCFEVVDRTDEVSNHIYGKVKLTWFEEIFEEYHTKKPCSSSWGARLFEFQLFFCSKEVFRNKSCKNTTNDWGKDENPYLLKGCATDQDSWCQATSWVNWKSSNVQSNKDHRHQGQADYQTSDCAIALACWCYRHDN